MKKSIAHIITLTSLIIGIIAIIESFYLNFSTTACLIFICCFLDGLDGTIARWLKINSEFGKQLDSFSDMIAFGIAPAMLMYNFINHEFNNQILAYISLAIPICATIRLANYNISEFPNMFSGLTTPVGAIFFSSIPLINLHEKNHLIREIILNQYTITISIIIVSILFIIQFPTFHVRLDSIKHNTRKMLFIFISMLILFIFSFTGIIGVIIMYIMLNVFKAIN